MKKLLLFFFGTILTINCYSQISFEKGYYINNSSQKIECLILNNDWKNNPIDFECKILENDKTKIVSLKSVKEFGIYNILKYVRKTVHIDRSSESINDLSYDKNPQFQEEQLFLKVLIEGKANLYSYEEGNLRRYFYNTVNFNVKQLIFKSYQISGSQIGKNNRFRQQLWSDLKCSETKMNTIEKLVYKKHSLVHFFSQYNKCSNSDFVNFEEKQKRDAFNLTLRPRLRNSSLIIQNPASSSFKDIDFGNKLGFGFGVEAELILPFNKNKWGVSIEPTYQLSKTEKTTESDNVSGGILISEVKYNSIEIPLSVRHYLFLNNNSKFFINASLVIDLNLNSTIEFKRTNNSIFKSEDIETQSNLALGMGYKLNDRYSLEARYQTSRKISKNSDYKTLSIIFGYSLF